MPVNDSSAGPFGNGFCKGNGAVANVIMISGPSGPCRNFFNYINNNGISSLALVNYAIGNRNCVNNVTKCGSKYGVANYGIVSEASCPILVRSVKCSSVKAKNVKNVMNRGVLAVSRYSLVYRANTAVAVASNGSRRNSVKNVTKRDSAERTGVSGYGIRGGNNAVGFDTDCGKIKNIVNRGEANSVGSYSIAKMTVSNSVCINKFTNCGSKAVANAGVIADYIVGNESNCIKLLIKCNSNTGVASNNNGGIICTGWARWSSRGAWNKQIRPGLAVPTPPSPARGGVFMWSRGSHGFW